jgi:hypothetical protein
MKGAVTVFCCCLALGRAVAQPQGDITTAYSVSGQFVARAARQPVSPSGGMTVRPVPGGFLLGSNFKPTEDSATPQDPALLVISCEQIKQSLLATLGVNDQWRGKINLFINPSLPEDQGPFFSARAGPDGWSYQLTLPPAVKPRLLLRAIVQALLVEMANRGTGGQAAEVPIWLVAGMSAHLQAGSLTGLVLRPQVSTSAERVRLDGLETVRAQLRGRAPLTFQELSWPRAELLTGDNFEFYSGCSQLFLDELLRLRDGRRGLDEMIRQLPRHLNWQTAFLQAFSPQFGQLLDVEKWWDLTCVSFSQVDAADHFTLEDSWVKFEDSLTVPVEVRRSAEELPAPSQITLQEVIATWDPPRAAPVLRQTVQSLELLRLKAAPELAALLDGYLAALQSWIQDTRPQNPAWSAKDPEAQLAGLRRLTCQELTALDRRRAALRSQKVPAAAPPRLGAAAGPPGPADVYSSNNRNQPP